MRWTRGVRRLVKLSRESEYGLEALIVLARQGDGKVMLLREIAEARGLPAGFLAKILQKLARHQLVSSHRGAVRGYSLARPAGRVSLREILEALEGSDLFSRCVFWPGRCADEKPCRLHEQWAMIRPRFQAMMEQVTLEQVAKARR